MTAAPKRLLVVFHSQGDAARKLAEAVAAGAERGEAEVRLRMAADADLDSLLWADGLVICSPENFGYMAGMIKDFFDRTFYPAQGKVEGLPYAVVIKCSNDGSGALSNIERIAKGYPFKKVADPIIVRGDLEDTHLQQADELGETLAAGLSMGIF